MNNAQELKAHLQDRNKARIYAEKKNKHNVLIARMYEAKKMEKKEIKKELQSILKDYHYNSDTENMSKDVVVALENLVGGLK